MAEDLFAKLEPETLRALFRTNPAFHIPIVLIDSALHVLACNEQAERAFFLASMPVPSVDKWLSLPTQDILKQFFAEQSNEADPSKKLYSLREWKDGTEYQLEVFPHSQGALLVFYHEEHTSYDGSLRVMQLKITEVLNAILVKIDQMKSVSKSKKNTANTAELEKQCLRLYRLVKHMEFLHEPPDPTILSFESEDIVALCHTVMEQVQKKTTCTLVSHLPPSCFLFINEELIKIALYNLLVNAVQVSPANAMIQVSLHNTPQYITITVADQGRKLTAEQFEALLYGWQRAASHRSYIAEKFGFGLPVTQLVARLHDGQLLFSPQEDSGNAIHLSLSHFPRFSNIQEVYQTPVYISQAYSLEEIELSAL